MEHLSIAAYNIPRGTFDTLFQAKKKMSPIVTSDFFGQGYPDVAQDNMKDQAQLKYAVCMGILVMLHPGGWIGECAATMLSYKGRRLAGLREDGFQPR